MWTCADKHTHTHTTMQITYTTKYRLKMNKVHSHIHSRRWNEKKKQANMHSALLYDSPRPPIKMKFVLFESSIYMIFLPLSLEKKILSLVPFLFVLCSCTHYVKLNVYTHNLTHTHSPLMCTRGERNTRRHTHTTDRDLHTRHTIKVMK